MFVYSGGKGVSVSPEISALDSGRARTARPLPSRHGAGV